MLFTLSLADPLLQRYPLIHLGTTFSIECFGLDAFNVLWMKLRPAEFSLDVFIYSIELSCCHSNVSWWISV